MCKKIDVVIVTYNRLEKLKRAINAFNCQTTLPMRIIVVNNNSNDGTTEFLEEWKKQNYCYEKVVINLSKNFGGSGGFFKGIEYALNNNAEWIWVSDDDAYPKKHAIELATNYINNHDMSNISAICGKVIQNNSISYDHRRKVKRGLMRIKQIPLKRKNYNKDEFDIDLFTYVGTIMNVDKLRQVGNVNKDLFIYYDDTEHSWRLRKVGRIVCIPRIEIIHDLKVNMINEKFSWKNYYMYRNKLYFIKNYFGSWYTVFEKFLIYLRIIKKHNHECTKLIFKSIKDFDNKKLGVDKIYNPSWKIKK